jgi:hypothetical protein
MTVLSSDDILMVVEDVFELAAPEVGFLGELVADALLIACHLPTRWWKRNGGYVAIGVVALGLITLIGWNPSRIFQ